MLFGARTESRANVLEPHDVAAPSEPVNAAPAGDTVPADADTTAVDAADSTANAVYAC